MLLVTLSVLFPYIYKEKCLLRFLHLFIKCHFNLHLSQT